MNQKMIDLQKGVKKYLKDLGLDMSKYKVVRKLIQDLLQL